VGFKAWQVAVARWQAVEGGSKVRVGGQEGGYRRFGDG